ncbi:MAG: PriCT-2 domain-containing protein [Cocleimonas sp.]|nr:PriCT-2 domain-containing protein [Cocleimonas sp.]
MKEHREIGTDAPILTSTRKFARESDISFIYSDNNKTIGEKSDNGVYLHPVVQLNKFNAETIEKAVAALNFIPNDISRSDWVKIGTALKTEFGDSAKDYFLDWSDNGKSTDRSNAKSTWSSIQAGRVSIKTLYWYARQHGYTEERQHVSNADHDRQKAEILERRAQQAKQLEVAKQHKLAEQQRAQTAINEVLPALIPATPNSTPYLKNKKSNGQGAYVLYADDVQRTNTARFTYPFSDVNKGALLIPFQSHEGELVGAQLIYGGKKRQVKGSIKKGAYAYIGLAPLPLSSSTIYITEGYATANSAIQANPEAFAVMAIDSGNLPLVSELIRERYQNANIVILGDNDKSGAGQAKAKEAEQYANNALTPEWIDGQVKSTDFNDVHIIKGLGSLKEVLFHLKSSSQLETVILQENVLELPAWLNDTPPDNYDYCIPSDYDYDHSNPANPANPDNTNQEKKTNKTTIINQRYLADAIEKNLESHRFLGVHSPYGTGKTTSLKNIIKVIEGEKRAKNSTPNILFVTPRTSLCIAISEDFEAIYNYLDAKNKKDFTKAERLKMIDSMATCPQSLGALIDESKNDTYDLVIFDESESITKLLVSTATKDKERTLYAMQRVVRSSNKVVFMDADYGDVSKLFSELLTGIMDTHILKNIYKPWNEYTAKIITGGSFSDRKEALSSMMMQDITGGENTALFSSSATFCTDLHEVVEVICPESNSKLATSETDNQELMSDPKTVSKINNLFYSPSLSVGISFDIKNHVNRVYGCLSNEINTPDSEDAGQGMARFRNPSNKEWVIALDDRKNIYIDGDEPLLPEDISKSIMARFMGNIKAISSNLVLTPDLTNQVLDLYALVESRKRDDKNNFNKNFIDKLVNLGMNVEYVEAELFFEGNDIKSAMKENKAERIERVIQNTINAPKINEEENKILSARRRLGQRLTNEEKSILERYYLETAFSVDFDKMNNNEKREIISYKGDGFITKAVMRSQVEASRDFDKAYIAMGLNGVGDEEAGKRDILHKHHNYRLKKKLHAYALPYTDCDKEYSHKTLKRTGFYQWLIKNKKDINILIPNFVPSNFKSKPASLMNKLLENMGYKHTCSRDEKSKKREYIYRSVLNAPFDRFYGKQLSRGDNWVECTEKILEGLETHREVLSAKDIRCLQMPVVHVRFVSEKLAKIPKIQHQKIMSVYKEKYDIMRHGMNANIIANLWLENETKKYNICDVQIA